ncbi:SGNH/GDSL hydrolase family protein [Nonomuraea sp. LPB2021202275-12-8]|uniref:SGNH/GDSL hydrolase family protein n=1 Tax=Nonomuraea sp. LPB2021202275-12-8 TaxID=3120159 RepID=UPI00300C548D
MNLLPLRLMATTGVIALIMAAAPAASASANGGWSSAWATAHQHPRAGNEWEGANWSPSGFAQQSVRQVVRVSAGGSRVRIRLSNLYGTGPLRLAGATIARAAEAAAVRPGTARVLRFRGSQAATIPAGRVATSDAVPLATRPLEKLTVTLYFAEPTGPATFHEGGLTTSYLATGDRRFDLDGRAFAGATSHSWYFLAGVDVGGRVKGSVVAFGDSITDGAITTPGADNRYPDELAERLVAAGKHVGVVNAGINGNMLLADSPCFAGEKGLARFERDALGQPGVRTVIVLEGINDIGLGGKDSLCGKVPAVTVSGLIEGHRQLIRAAHARGIKIIGATLTPMKGNPYYYNALNEAARDDLNHWIRTSGEYDAVADLDRALANPDDPDAMLPAYAAADLLHPNDAGMKAIAATVEARLR